MARDQLRGALVKVHEEVEAAQLVHHVPRVVLRHGQLV